MTGLDHQIQGHCPGGDDPAYISRCASGGCCTKHWHEPCAACVLSVELVKQTAGFLRCSIHCFAPKYELSLAGLCHIPGSATCLPQQLMPTMTVS